MSDHLILVDENDNEIGQAEKLAAHQQGLFHRAFSIFIFNQANELMLQRRAAGKYHCGSLWTNTCCSHPRPGEDTKKAAQRRLREEMGFACPLSEIFNFSYRAEFANGLIENEFDHVLFGRYDQAPSLNPEEADDWRWISLADLEKEIKNNPDAFTPWLKIICPRIRKNLRQFA